MHNGPLGIVAYEASYVTQSGQIGRSKLECLCSAGFRHRHDLLLQAFPGLLQTALYHSGLEVQQGCCLLIGIALEVVVDDHVSVGGTQSSDRLPHQRPDLLLLLLGRCREVELIQKIELRQTAPLPHACFVVRNRAQPGTEPLGGTQLR